MTPHRMLIHAALVALGLGLGSAGQLAAQGREPKGTVHLAATAADRSLREWDTQVDRMARAGELRLVSTREDTVLAGRTHQRFDQYYRGVRVFGAQVARQLEGEVTASIFGTLHEAIDVETTPALSEAQAVERAGDLTGGTVMTNREPELVILPQDDGYALAWLVNVRAKGDIFHLFVDARTGTELWRLTMIHRQAAVGSGLGVRGDRKKLSTTRIGNAYFASDDLRPPAIETLDLKGNLFRAELLLEGVEPVQSDVASDTDNTWNDPAVVDAHAHLGWTYDYLFKRFGRRGLDNADRRILAIVHPVNRANVFSASEDEVFLFYVNAFYCPRCGPNGVGMLSLGDGLPTGAFILPSGQYVDYYSASLDIVAHELAHGVTAYSSNLTPFREAGALNEAFSDIIGVSAEFYFATTGKQQTDYLVGEDTYRPFRPGSIAGVRSLSDPGVLGNPDHYSRRFTGQEDNGGIHINATIPGHAFYLAIEGGTNRTSGLSVQGVGAGNREQIEKIFYRAFVSFLTPNATFADARRATLQAATELYGGSSAAFRAVQQAWDAVGVS